MRRIYLLLVVGTWLGGGSSSPASAMDPDQELSLEDAISRALASHESLAQAREAVAVAEAGRMEARAGRLPRLSLASQYTHNLKKSSFFLPADFSHAFGGASKVEMGGDFGVSGALTASLSLWTAGRLSAASGVAREWIEITTLREAIARDYLRFQVRVSYCRALLALETYRIQEKALAETEEAIRVARAGFEAGTVSQFDVQRAEVELANRRAPLVEAQNEVDLALLALSRLCGLSVKTHLCLTDTLSMVAPPRSVENLLTHMEAQSPELRALDHAVRLQEEQVRLEKAARWPVLQLSGQYVWQGEWDEDPVPDEDQLATSASIALGVAVPIFDGLETKAKIQAAQSNLSSAQLERNRVRRDKELAVRQAFLELASALATLEGRREAVLLAEEAHRLALVRLENGLATPLERLDAESAMTTSRAQLAAALFAANVAEATLELTVGAPLRESQTDTTGRTDHE
jgi:outer membrane protein TolC